MQEHRSREVKKIAATPLISHAATPSSILQAGTRELGIAGGWTLGSTTCLPPSQKHQFVQLLEIEVLSIQEDFQNCLAREVDGFLKGLTTG
jgi:hypothetical protein